MREYVRVANDIWQEQTTIDWEQRRYEIAKGVMQSYMAQHLGTLLRCPSNAKDAAFFALRCADALIGELKQER